ncbi:hypothetical protein OF83DRAFT_1250680 [Amylostereum chailletii]|nr:hypothetical protein OF83DRAFT_1250680 [Amylostereum chailletii]
MNNLLRALASSQLKPALPDTDFKLLLQTVKDARKQNYDIKVSDPFHDALEDLLHDLRTVTMDNHDADAFLKPVSRSEVPDYYDVIQQPMDLQTMLKKVKQRAYKSKAEFKDDLDLIWANCFTYNATENHPLRLCASRLKLKAERLLKYITDRKERADPPIPREFALPNHALPKLNGINGHHRTPSLPKAVSRPRSSSISSPMRAGSTPASSRRDLEFGEMPALIRTADGMGAFRQLDQAVEDSFARPNTEAVSALQDRLRQYVPDIAIESGDEDVMAVDGDLGDKRKLNGTSQRPRKRQRLSPGTSSEPIEMWWQVQQSDTLLANSLPPLPTASSSAHPSSSFSSTTSAIPTDRRPTKRKRKRPKAVARPNSLLALMNTNIATLRRVRKTHTKFAMLNGNGGGDEDDEDGMAGPMRGLLTGDENEVDVDESPWMLPGSSATQGVDIGEGAADQCLHWVNGKILEHAGFQGTSKMALDVMSSITAEYLHNVGRTFRFYTDKYCNSMTSEEIILHSLFESGVTGVHELERYIKDDVVRQGNRLNDLEKKVVNAYQEVTSNEIVDDDALFANEDEEGEDSAFVMGQFTEDIGEDFLGLRELGIAAELGLSNLSIPKKLLKGKRSVQNSLVPAKSAEPPPPYPPPPPFIPLTSDAVDDQIGVLKAYYQRRFSALIPPMQPAPLPGPPPLAAPTFLSAHPPFYPHTLPHPPHPSIRPPQPPAPVPPPVLVLPDDPPHPSRTKLGPIGHVITGGGAKKKPNKAKEMAAAATPARSPAPTLPPSEPSSPRKKAPAGPAVPGRKRGRPPNQPQPPPQQQHPDMPAVVVASA